MSQTTTTTTTSKKHDAAVRFARQAENLGLAPRDKEDDSDEVDSTTAVRAIFVTEHDPVIVTASGDRLPAVPLTEAQKLNELREEIEKRDNSNEKVGADSAAESDKSEEGGSPVGKDLEGTFRHKHGDNSPETSSERKSSAPLGSSLPPSRTNPLFPPLPLYGPPSLLRTLQCYVFRFTSFWLSLGFLAVVVLGSAFTSIPLMFMHIWLRLTFRHPDSRRPFNEEEKRRKEARKEADKAWKRDKRKHNNYEKTGYVDKEGEAGHTEEFVPTEGGPDPIVCDVGYYARRVGLDMEEYKVQTEDGFIITLWHIYNPREYTPATVEERGPRDPTVFEESSSEKKSTGLKRRSGPRRYPILLIHGLLQSAGAYCTNDDDSLAFYLAKSGYDVWLGNNRCGFTPEHKLLRYKDPRFWCWNIRQMGVMDLPALVSRVLHETSFSKLGLVCHSQGTTQTFVALAKDQRPSLGQHLSVFCALAPAAYSGPLIRKIYFKFMRIISPGMFRIFFGIHAFIPFMMTMHSTLPSRLYGAMGYRVFSFLFNWTDDRWERDLRDRMFQFAPVYVSAESMRWWLGRECFAKHKCILSTREETKAEEQQDAEEDRNGRSPSTPLTPMSPEPGTDPNERGITAWYDEQAPPFAMWIAGSDELVDGKRLLRRFERGREPHVNIVHAKVIEEYEHLDVIWALDSIEQVGREVKDVIWRTAEVEAKKVCAVPRECEGL